MIEFLSGIFAAAMATWCLVNTGDPSIPRPARAGFAFSAVCFIVSLIFRILSVVPA